VQHQEIKRTDRRVERTRRLILEALPRLLEQKSFSDITVQDIAHTATVNRVTFYAHFEDKYALLDVVIRQRFRAQLSEGTELESEPESLLHKTALNVFRYVDGHRRCSVLKELEPRLVRSMQDELYHFLRAVMDDSAALVASWAIIGAASQWRTNKSPEPMEHLVHRIAGVLSAAVTSERLLTA
jgi:AcrR family transcriptional regulator